MTHWIARSLSEPRFLTGRRNCSRIALQFVGKTRSVERLTVDEFAFDGMGNVRDVATRLSGHDRLAYLEDTPWSFTRFYMTNALDAGAC
ncbi:hypothetical protein AAGS40_30595 (plasmid) [Paraburkholderia sp. PREW-6R]|uniref:hypothetical protein n=1 Tax=Paraburkholderia sp. PREW-6R TaxID=3141544 RepID=UPI0031F520B1